MSYLKYELKRTCTECPYSNKIPGWIGSHTSAEDFHIIAKTDQTFSCHMSTKQACVGNALYMNKLCKRSQDKDKANFQDSLRNNTENILFSFTGETLIKFHGK